jgi:hypothetical protein
MKFSVKNDFQTNLARLLAVVLRLTLGARQPGQQRQA